MISWESWNGSPLIRTAFTSVNTVLLTPMPSASVIIATRVNPGFFPIMRMPKRMSWNSPIDGSRPVTKQSYRKFELLFIGENEIERHGCRHDQRRQSSQKEYSESRQLPEGHQPLLNP